MNDTQVIKAISLWQPYASLIALGFKKFETRKYRTHIRGRIAIHAAKKCLRDHEIQTLINFIAANRQKDPLSGKCISFLEGWLRGDQPKITGAIIAVCDLTKCLKVSGIPVEKEDEQSAIHFCDHSINCVEKYLGDWSINRYVWKLENVNLIEPLDFKGRQGWFNVDEKK